LNSSRAGNPVFSRIFSCNAETTTFPPPIYNNRLQIARFVTIGGDVPMTRRYLVTGPRPEILKVYLPRNSVTFQVLWRIGNAARLRDQPNENNPYPKRAGYWQQGSWMPRIAGMARGSRDRPGPTTRAAVVLES
jgi:hypothetical protein